MSNIKRLQFWTPLTMQDWQKTLLDTGLTSKVPVGGSKESGPFSGDALSIVTPIFLIGISLAGFILYGYTRRKQNEK